VSNLDPADSSATPTNRGKIYTFGYSSGAIQIMASRTAEVHAKFFLPYLRAGMRVLDCGCGPGSITVGLAKAVAPGEAVGIDIEPAQLDMARTHAGEQAVTNVQFRIDYICDLSFPDGAFDAIFGHTILMQFAYPIRALAEVRRVLKPEASSDSASRSFQAISPNRATRHRTSSGSYSGGAGTQRR
jgi:ubiquinone/menaquinone biosynthesis C-methylase UbiE